MSDASTGTQAATPDQNRRSVEMSRNADDRPDACGRYDLRGEIARGGMGVVSRAWDRVLHREVAVKLIHPRIVGSIAEQQFLEEANITGQLQHPGIPPVYDLGTMPDGRPFLAMKLIDGRTFDALLKEAPSETSRWLAVFERICQAVGFAHSNRVIHRDLKPQNVMVGAFGEVQVMDWGLAKILTDPGSESTVDFGASPRTPLYNPRAGMETQSGSSMGTPAYMPPEQARGEVDRVAERADVFGLGAILCAVLTGQPPFAAPSAAASLRMAAAGELSDALARLDASGAESEWIALAKRCLSPNPDDRPANGSIVAGAVAALRADADRRARQAETDRAQAEVRMVEQRARQRAALVGAGLLVLVLAAGVVGTTLGLRAARAARTAEADRADGESRAKDAAILARNKALHALEVTTSDLLGDALARQDEVAPEQKRFLAEVLSVYQQLAAEQGDDERTRVQVAEAAFRVALIEFQFGRHPESTASHRLARDAYARLAADYPDNREYRVQLAQCHHSYAVGLNELDRVAEAEGEYRIALQIRRQLVLDSEASPDDRFRLGWTLNNLGNLADENDRTTEAERLLRDAMDIWDALAADFPDHRHYQHKSSWVHMNYALLLRKLRRAPAAEEHARTALRIRERLLERYPADPRYRADYASGLENLADFRRRRGDPAETERLHRKALEYWTALASDFPAVDSHRSRKADAHRTIADFDAKAGRLDDALAQYRDAIRVSERRHAADPTNLETIELLHECHERMGRLAERLESWEQARADRHLALRYATLLHDRDPQDIDYARWRAAAQYALGLLETRANRIAEARELFESAAKLQDELVLDDPDDKDFRFELANSLQNLGNLAAAAGDWPAAESRYARVLVLRRLSDPESWPSFQAQFLLGRALARQQRWSDAEPHLLAVQERFARDPGAVPKSHSAIAFENGMILAARFLAIGETTRAGAILRILPREVAPRPRVIQSESERSRR